MKILNILKRFGGTVIKLKSKRINWKKVFLAMGIGFLSCIGFFFLLDQVFNGVFLDWFSKNYMYTRDLWTNDVKQPVFAQEVNWSQVKWLLFWAFVILVLLWILSLAVVSFWSARQKEREMIADTGEMIRRYLQQEKHVSEIFPQEYAQISAPIMELKASSQRQEQLLREEAGRKNDLITYLAHDLKTPLTSVIGYLSLLEEAPDMPQEQKAKYVSITLEKAKRLERLINEFFDITRYNLQQVILEKERIDLSYLLVQLTDEFYPLLQEHSNQLSLNIPEHLEIYGDPDKLARVFNNILKNAIAYSYPETVIKLWTEKTENNCLIFFQNQGKTIPKQKLESVFEKFFRLDDARSTNTGGAGLGLAIAKEIVSLHGGKITASSEEEITTFCVTLPLR